MTENLQPTETADQPDHFAEIAAALYRIADSIVTLAGSDLPKARFNLTIQPGVFKGSDDLNAGAVDAVTSALFGHPGRPDLMGDGSYLYTNSETGVERVGPVDVRVLTGVSTEWVRKREAGDKLAEREAELEKLRAEVAELRGQVAADASGLLHSREPESTVVTPVPAGVDGHPEGRAAGIVPEPIAKHYETGGWTGGPGGCGVDCACGVGFGGFDTLAEAVAELKVHIAAGNGEAPAAEPITRYFSFGHGQTDPVSGVSLLNHYVTVVATTAEDCREAMFASRFGNRWAFEYIPGTPQADEWIPQWTEHERIDATSLRAGEHGRVTNPDLARFLAGKEYKRREAAHFLGLEESAKHYPAESETER